MYVNAVVYNLPIKIFVLPEMASRTSMITNVKCIVMSLKAKFSACRNTRCTSVWDERQELRVNFDHSLVSWVFCGNWGNCPISPIFRILPCCCFHCFLYVTKWVWFVFSKFLGNLLHLNMLDILELDCIVRGMIQLKNNQRDTIDPPWWAWLQFSIIDYGTTNIWTFIVSQLLLWQTEN